jgi:amidase
MTGFPEFTKYDGLGLAELVRKNKVTATELLEESIRRIEEHNPRINAVINKLYDRARAAIEAGLPQGPFMGVPFLLKDLIYLMEGVPTSGGNRVLKNYPAPHDSELVRRWKASGVVILGKTNAPELGLVPFTEPEAFGACRNPWDTTRITSGSSGGSAAAVAARMVPLACGGDGGGSIRGPASACGVFGFKPTRGSTPTGPDLGEYWRGFNVDHVLTISVRDSAAMLDATYGADVGAPYMPPPRSSRSFLQEAGSEPGKLRIAFSTQPFLGKFVHPDVVKATQDAASLLEDLGHEVVEAAPEIDAEQFSVDFLTIVAGEVRAILDAVSKRTGRKLSSADYEEATYAVGLFGKLLSAGDYAGAANRLQGMARRIGAFFQDYEMLLTPVLSQPPVHVGSLQPTPAEKSQLRLVGRFNAGWLLNLTGGIKPLADRAFEQIPWLPMFNVTGQPAMSMPLHWTEAGLPVGVQLVGRFGADATLFSLAGQLEGARPWRDRIPPGFD